MIHARANEWTEVAMMGIGFACLTESEVVDAIVASASVGSGGRLVTPNLSILRATRFDNEAHRLVSSARLRVADGMPIVWAARIAGTPIPGRVTGADLIWSLCAAAARLDTPVYLLGGDTQDIVQRAAAALTTRYPSLRIVAARSPKFGFEKDLHSRDAVIEDILARAPGIVFVGLGFPKQELLAEDIERRLPSAWVVGCGAAINFASGSQPRAPHWMMNMGLEWFHRMVSDPKRLVRRYSADLVFSARLAVWAVRQRFGGDQK